MKNILPILVVVIISLVGCDLIELERDNPFDSNSKNYNQQSNNENSRPEIIYHSYKLLTSQSWYSDHIKPGATIAVCVVLKNTSKYDAKNVAAVYSIDKSYIDGGINTLSVIGDIYSNNLSIDKEHLVFTVSKNATVGGKINISMTLKDEYGNTWNISFSLVVE